MSEGRASNDTVKKNQGNQNKYSTKVTGLKATLPHVVLINHSNGFKMLFFVCVCNTVCLLD